MLAVAFRGSCPAVHENPLSSRIQKKNGSKEEGDGQTVKQAGVPWKERPVSLRPLRAPLCLLRA